MTKDICQGCGWEKEIDYTDEFGNVWCKECMDDAVCEYCKQKECNCQNLFKEEKA